MTIQLITHGDALRHTAKRVVVAVSLTLGGHLKTGHPWPLENRPVAELVDSAKGKEGRFATPRVWSYLLAPLRLTREGGSSCHGSARNGRGASSGRGRPSRRAYR